jgi:hypothetical protein
VSGVHFDFVQGGVPIDADRDPTKNPRLLCGFKAFFWIGAGVPVACRNTVQSRGGSGRTLREGMTGCLAPEADGGRVQPTIGFSPGTKSRRLSEDARSARNVR